MKCLEKTQLILGKLNEKYKSLKDISNRELFTVVPIAFFVFLFGVYPAPLVNLIAPAIENLINIVQSVM